MPSYLHPGVYTREIPSPSRSIEVASTSTTIFVGETERGPLLPTLILNRTEYDRSFGGYLAPASGATKRLTMAYAMDQFFQNGGTKAYVLRAFGTANRATAKGSDPEHGAATRNTAASGSPAASTVKLIASSAGVWANYSGTADTTSTEGSGTGMNALILPSSDGATNKFRIVVIYAPPYLGGKRQIVENWDRLSTDTNDENYVVDTLKRSLYIRWYPNWAAALPAGLAANDPNNPGDLTTVNNGGVKFPSSDKELLMGATSSTGFGTGNAPGGSSSGIGGDTDVSVNDYPTEFTLLDDITDASIMVTPLAARLNDTDSSKPYDLYRKGQAYVEARPQRDLFFIGDMARQKSSQLASEFTSATLADYNGGGAINTGSALPTSTFTALYVPWAITGDPVGAGRNPQIALSPSAAMAGLYARTDANRGVWKAPAGVEATVADVNKLEFELKDAHQDLLNPKGINVIRSQPGAGPVSWGARTTVPASEWRYIPVRRTAIMLRVSIYQGIQFAVFEPNDEPLWATLRLTIGNFMNILFRNGAFAGAKPSDAYFVKCNAETTTPADQLAGIVNVLVGFSPLRPAEFVIVSLSQIVNQKA